MHVFKTVGLLIEALEAVGSSDVEGSFKTSYGQNARINTQLTIINTDRRPELHFGNTIIQGKPQIIGVICIYEINTRILQAGLAIHLRDFFALLINDQQSI